jgi:hypothetical protein
MWKEYAVSGGTFWENLRRKRGDKNLPPNHHAAKSRYDLLKKKYADEDGDIVIDRKKEADEKAVFVKKTNGIKITSSLIKSFLWPDHLV